MATRKTDGRVQITKLTTLVRVKDKPDEERPVFDRDKLLAAVAAGTITKDGDTFNVPTPYMEFGTADLADAKSIGKACFDVVKDFRDGGMDDEEIAARFTTSLKLGYGEIAKEPYKVAGMGRIASFKLADAVEWAYDHQPDVAAEYKRRRTENDRAGKAWLIEQYENRTR